MLQNFILLLLLIATTGLISCEYSDNVECTGVISSDKLELGVITEEGRDALKGSEITNLIPDCTSLEIRAENGVEIIWKNIERVSMPKLKTFNLHLIMNNFIGREFEWSSISLFGYKPEEISQLGIDSYLFVNEDEVFNFDGPQKYLYIYKINPNPILSAFEGVSLESVHISDTIFKDINFIVPEGVVTVALDNVQVNNLPECVQKFKSLEDLHIIQNYETIDLADLIQSKTLKSLFITNATLTSARASARSNIEPSESLKTLVITDCLTDTSFKENAWKVMPNLTTLEYTSPGNLDLNDLLVYNQLTHLHLASATLIFTKPAQKYTTLEGLHLTNCEFDLTKFAEVAWDTFPNLKYVGVDASEGGTKPTQEFLNYVLLKLPNIQQVALHPFEFMPTPSDRYRKGTFEITYNSDSQSPE